MATHQILVVRPGKADLLFSPANLKNDFPQHSLDCATQCSGKRREQLHKFLAKTEVLPKSGCPFINYSWKGPRLKDILLAAEVEPSPDSQVLLLSAIENGSRLGVKISLGMALSKEAEITLALAVDGQDILLDSGYPVRLVIPGAAGSRSIKQLERIEVIPKGHTSKPVDIAQATEKIYDNAPYTKIGAFIAVPENGDLSLQNDESVQIRGYAIPQGGDGPIQSAEISLDDGKSWQTAKLFPGGKWSWSIFSADCQAGSSSKVQCRVKDSGDNIFISKD